MKSSSCNCSGFPPDSLFDLFIFEAILPGEVGNRFPGVESRRNHCRRYASSSNYRLAKGYRRVNDNVFRLFGASLANERIEFDLVFVIHDSLQVNSDNLGDRELPTARDIQYIVDFLDEDVYAIRIQSFFDEPMPQ